MFKYHISYDISVLADSPDTQKSTCMISSTDPASAVETTDPASAETLNPKAIQIIWNQAIQIMWNQLFRCFRTTTTDSKETRDRNDSIILAANNKRTSRLTRSDDRLVLGGLYIILMTDGSQFYVTADDSVIQADDMTAVRLEEIITPVSLKEIIKQLSSADPVSIDQIISQVQAVCYLEYTLEEYVLEMTGENPDNTRGCLHYRLTKIVLYKLNAYIKKQTLFQDLYY